MYNEIKNTPDQNLKQWQRQLKINMFMVNFEVRKNIEELVEPIVNIQQKLRRQIKLKFVKKFEDNDN